MAPTRLPLISISKELKEEISGILNKLGPFLRN